MARLLERRAIRNNYENKSSHSRFFSLFSAHLCKTADGFGTERVKLAERIEAQTKPTRLITFYIKWKKKWRNHGRTSIDNFLASFSLFYCMCTILLELMMKNY